MCLIRESMNKKRVLGILLFVFSLIILFWGNNNLITGNAVGESFSFSFVNMIGFILLIGSFVVLISSKKTLDYLVIPEGEDEWKQGRLDRALEEKKSGRKIKKMYWMKGKDSEEDILLLGEKVKSGERIGFDTFPLHYLEYKELIKKTQRDGKFSREVKTENLATEQGVKEWIYGIIGLGEEILKRRKLNYKKNRNEKYLGKIKELVHKFI